MAKVVMYTKDGCSYCVRAQQLLTDRHIPYEEIHIDKVPGSREEMIARSGRQTVPQIFINDQPIGGFDDLWALSVKGELDRLLASS
ncbi:MAG: glutaredoxin 3 [Gammaproteobacteria bacterium]